MTPPRRFTMRRDPEAIASVRDLLKESPLFTGDIDRMSDELVIETAERFFNGFYDKVVPAMQRAIRGVTVAAARAGEAVSRLNERLDWDRYLDTEDVAEIRKLPETGS